MNNDQTRQTETEKAARRNERRRSPEGRRLEEVYKNATQTKECLANEYWEASSSPELTSAEIRAVFYKWFDYKDVFNKAREEYFQYIDS